MVNVVSIITSAALACLRTSAFQHSPALDVDRLRADDVEFHGLPLAKTAGPPR